MTSAGAIKHSGEVIRIDGSTIYVKMTVSSACGSCQARMVCGASESADKVVEVESSDAANYQVGDKVEVALQKRSMGVRSVVLAYLIPLIVLSAVLFCSVMAGVEEGIAALIAILGVGCYYVALYMSRNKIGKTVKFIITKQTK
ncbi:MAG: SoxR reducing system RseC family protein [Alistipes sp.]|nr:SoxR reducing system RseC family protein [Alistipes sp.]